MHGEGDGLPSLVVDRYGDYLADPDAVAGHGGAEGRDRGGARGAAAAARASWSATIRGCATLEGLEPPGGLLHGEVPERSSVTRAASLRGRPLEGQKTGLFLDQRENHLMAAGYARGRVLDGFTYNGGFA